MKRIKIEVCASTPESIKAAYMAGATRVELCSNLNEGGVTPPTSWIEYAKNFPELEVFILIRPRGGNFVYTDVEFETMKLDILHCGKLRCDGVVFGVLTEDNKIDINKNKQLIEIAKYYGMKTTFHRAIDHLENPILNVELVKKLGFDRILTSGGETSVLNGMETLKKMIKTANNEIIIMPGGGVTAENISLLAKELDTSEFHGSFGEKISFPCFNKLFESDFTISQSSENQIKEAIKNANNLCLK